MTIQTHDFTRPPSLRPETKAKLAEWLTRSNALLTEAIAGYGIKVEIQLDECFSAWPAPTLEQWSEKAVAFRVRLSDIETCSIFAFPNPLAQVLSGAMMGAPIEEWPAERDLTPAELSVGEVLVASITKSLTESWTTETPPSIRFVDCEPNLRRTKNFKPREPFVVCRTTIGTAVGSAQWCWMMPHEFLSKLFGSPRSEDSTSGISSRQQLESLAREMNAQLAIRLGTVQLTAVQMSELQVGDVVVLNQKTTEPLRAMVSGKVRFLGWPGRVGTRQAFEIASDATRRNRTPGTTSQVAATANH